MTARSSRPAKEQTVKQPPHADPTGDAPVVGRHDRVCVPDGRTGEALGCYRAADLDDQRMLVLYDSGGSWRHLRADLCLLD